MSDMSDVPQAHLLFGDWLTWNPSSLPPSPWNALVPFFAWLSDVVAPQLTVELGTGDGASFRPLCQIADRSRGQRRIVGIDSWSADTTRPWDGSAAHDALEEYCETHHPDVASLLRLDPQEAVGQFPDGSIDLLHIVATNRVADDAALEPTAWLAKVRPGGVIALTAADDEPDDSAGKLWQQVAECGPSAALRLPMLLGVAQVPRDGATPVVELLCAQPNALAALFRSLGERVEHRHVLGSDPRSPAAIRRHVFDVIEAGAADVQRVEAQHEVARAALEREVASLYDRVITKAREVDRLQDEADCLLAKLAAESARFEAQAREHDAERARLLADIAARDGEIVAMHQTVSWRVTRPLRFVQSLRLLLRRRRPRG